MRAIDYHLFTESLAIQLDQPVPVSVLFSGHPCEQFRRGREIRTKRLGNWFPFLSAFDFCFAGLDGP